MNLHDIIVKISKRRIPCFFISPHLDDAILSCGGLIPYLSEKTELKVVTVFTKSTTGRETKFARTFLNLCRFEDSEKLFKERRNEDVRVFKKLKIPSVHLNFIDAAWRKKGRQNLLAKILTWLYPEFIYLYPDESVIYSGRISIHDSATINSIKNKIVSNTGKKDEGIIFCPIGIGNHVDHAIIRNICSSLNKKIIYWEDFPYNLQQNSPHPKAENVIGEEKFKSFVWGKNLYLKRKLILGYRSQLYALFRNNSIPIVPEKYFFNETI